LTRLIGGPVPAWMVSVSIAASVGMLVPLVCAAVNWHRTLQGAYHLAREDVTLRFILVGAVSYLLAGLMGVILGTRTVSALTHFTYVEQAHVWLALLGFVAMVLFGCMYYIVPKVTRLEWPSARLIHWHFWCSLGGIGVVCLALAGGGLLQAIKLNNPDLPFMNAVKVTIPFMGIATLGWLVCLAGQALCLVNVLRLVFRLLAPWWKPVAAFLSGAEPVRQEARP